MSTIIPSTSTTAIYRFPHDLDAGMSGKWLMFKLVDPTSTFRVENGQRVITPLTAIATYLPASALATRYSVTYNDNQLGSTFGLVSDNLDPEKRGALRQRVAEAEFGLSREGVKNAAEAVRGLLGQGVDALYAEARDVTGTVLGGVLGGDVESVIAAATRRQVNQRMEVIFKSVDFREHNIELRFSARNAAEATTIQNIISVFKIGMLPDYEAGPAGTVQDAFFGFPYQWDFECSHQDSTFQIGRSVLRGMTVDYAPNSVAAFFKDGKPVDVTVSLAFQETELQTRGEYADRLAASGRVEANPSGTRRTYRF